MIDSTHETHRLEHYDSYDVPQWTYNVCQRCGGWYSPRPATRCPNEPSQTQRFDEYTQEWVLLECRECGGQLNILGKLGSKLWARCRNCGLDQEV